MSRTVNAPPSARPRRSLSPEDTSQQPKSAIPLFNTSVKGRGRLARLADYDPMSLDSSKAPSPANSAMDTEEGAGSAAGGAAGGAKKKTLKEKLKAAKDAVAHDEKRSKSKLGAGKNAGKPKPFSLGVDYVTLHEGRKKKLR